MTTRSPRRGGFTLIEVLTVMGIITLLAAITAAGVSRARATQMSRNTEHTVSKLQGALDQQLKAVADQAVEDAAKGRIPPAVFNACNKDRDLAGAAWGYMLVRQAFPQTFAEAAADVSGPGGFTLKKRNTFTSATGSVGGTQVESAVLLYLILSESANRGMAFNADDATQGAQGTVGGFRVFTDSWKTPIAFVRFAKDGFGGELNNPPYIKSGATSNDPFDPRAKLKNWTDTAARTALKGQVFSTTFATSASDFDTSNRQPAVVSAGPDGAFDGSYGSDDVVGYRVRQLGARGN